MDTFYDHARAVLLDAVNNIDNTYPTVPSLSETINKWHYSTDPAIYKADELPNLSDHAACVRVAMGFWMSELIQTLEFVEHNNCAQLQHKFDILLNHFCIDIKQLRSQIGRDVWMRLTADIELSDSAGVELVINYLVRNNIWPQQCTDRDGENLLDYLVFHFRAAIDSIVPALVDHAPTQWWEHSWNTSRMNQPWGTEEENKKTAEAAAIVRAAYEHVLLSSHVATTAVQTRSRKI